MHFWLPVVSGRWLAGKHQKATKSPKSPPTLMFCRLLQPCLPLSCANLAGKSTADQIRHNPNSPKRCALLYQTYPKTMLFFPIHLHVLGWCGFWFQTISIPCFDVLSYCTHFLSLFDLGKLFLAPNLTLHDGKNSTVFYMCVTCYRLRSTISFNQFGMNLVKNIPKYSS